MADHFEKAMQDIALKSAKNGGPTIQDVLTALVAKNDDDDEHVAAMRADTKTAKQLVDSVAIANDTDHKMILQTIDAHLVQAEAFFGRVTKLEAYKEDAQRTCEGRVKKLIVEEHKLVHDAHMKDLHPATSIPQSGISPLGRAYADPSDAQFTEHRESAFSGTDQSLREIIVGWKFSKWILGLVVIAVVGWILPFWADSCAARNYEKINAAEPATHYMPPKSSPSPIIP